MNIDRLTMRNNLFNTEETKLALGKALDTAPVTIEQCIEIVQKQLAGETEL